MLLLGVVAVVIVVAGSIGPWRFALPPAPQVAKPLTMEEARASNAAVPIETKRRLRALPYRFQGGPAAREQAAECLATAALYEAGDDRRGQQAVMQVVLNRVRAPGFPKTICGVVYQGSDADDGLPVLVHLRRIVPPAARCTRLGRGTARGAAGAGGLCLRRGRAGDALPYRLDGALLARYVGQGRAGALAPVLRAALEASVSRADLARPPPAARKQTMAKRFWAQIIELDEEVEAASIPGVTDHESAADALVTDFVGAMGGEITSGAVRVWIEGGAAKVYDWSAEFDMPEDADLDSDEDIEVEGEIVLTERMG